MGINGKALVWAINGVCALSIFFFGYDQGMMGGVNGAPDYIDTMGLGFLTPPTSPGGKVTATVTQSTKQGGIVAAYYLGTLIGCLLGGWLGDKLGRKKTIWIGSLWIIIGAPLQASAQNVAWMVMARIITGVGTGHLNAIVPVWSAETSGHLSRGFFIALEFTLNIFGVVVAYWLEYGLSFVGDGNTQIRWRFPIAFQLVPLVGLAIATFFMPESPRWLLKAGYREESLAILGRLRSDDGEVNDEARAEFNEIDQTIQMDGGEEPGYLRMFFSPCGKLHLSRRTQLAIWIQILQEWGGIAAITVYQPVIFGLAGFDASKAGWVSGVNTITYMFSTLICVFTLDRIGRRMTLFWGGAVQAFALIMAGVFVHLLTVQPEKTAQFGGAATFMVFLYTAVFGATWLTVPWIYPAEIWPVNARGKGNAMGVAGWSIGNGWCTLLVPVMFDKIKENALYIFGCANILAIVVVWAFYPETANRTLEEIDFLFYSDSPFVWAAEASHKRLKGELDAIVEAKTGTVHKEDTSFVTA
ncbi:general substrate transporter [Rhodotorula diobovata]|uniref:General substrate transporter n=1 Tax=Rhodotorula diobovata TaxID=5288 RepID=A0A5C5FM39_9BASI|nr:general substrate transporter [Rhodotorula diobovata]